jgi:hypothetical protein
VVRFLPEWQSKLHKRNVEKGFYDYKADAQAVADFLDRIYRSAEFEGLGGETPVKCEIDLSLYWSLARVLTDYKKAMVERKLFLVVGELCEAHEELRNGHELTEVYYKEDKPDKPEGFPVELADAEIRLLDLHEACKIDAEQMMVLKDNYNETRPYKHGRVF